MSNDEVTIVILAYNEAQRIGSVLQTLTEICDYEVLVINGTVLLSESGRVGAIVRRIGFGPNSEAGSNS